jgi:hypothetical protein
MTDLAVKMPDTATQEVAKPATTVLLSEEAERDLRGFSRATRALLARAMRDELLEPTNWINFKPVPEHPGSFVLPIGKFLVFVRPLEPGAGKPDTDGRFVERIYRAKDVESVESALMAAAASSG